MKASGGYVIHRRELVRGTVHSHTAALQSPISAADLTALNTVQATPWRINRFVLDTMMSAWMSGQRLPGVEKTIAWAVPPRLEDGVWNAMEAGERKERMRSLAEIHAFNGAAQSRERSLLDGLGVADELRDEPSIWYPHSRCFRGRIHPMTSAGPNPQGHDQNKSLLMFSAGLPVGPEGFYWLLVRAANCAGQDKLSLDERVGWTVDHKDAILASAADPFGQTWWTKADEPWAMLATCHELAQAWALSSPYEFVSHLPVPMDGTCNGLQHLSALGLDPVGARATNLTASSGRQDIYAEVRDVVRDLVQKDAAAGNLLAMEWHGKLDGSGGRKIVKRAVMTTPYGVTDRGIRTQLIKDGHCDGIEGAAGDAADYLCDKIVEGLGTVVATAKDIMAFLQTTAYRLASAGLPFDWQTPSGSTVRQAYHLTPTVRVETLSGRVSLVQEDRQASLSPRKQALGAAPNYVHSFDAAHLSLTVNRAAEEGVRSFALIHDSYGTHAANTPALARALRETFVEIYREDWLAKTAEFVAGYAPHVALPDLPKRGTFDLEEVRRSAFFFS